MLTTLRAAALAAAATLFALPAAADITFVLNNATTVDLMEFYASPTDASDWEEDILGEEILPAGGAGQVIIGEDRGCDYDIKMVFADGEELEDAINICETSEYTISEE